MRWKLEAPLPFAGLDEGDVRSEVESRVVGNGGVDSERRGVLSLVDYEIAGVAH